MRFTRTIAVSVMLALLVRCGGAFLPPQFDPEVGATSAPVPPGAGAKLSVGVAPAPGGAPVRPQTQLDRVRELVRDLGTPRCGARRIIDEETGLRRPDAEVTELAALGAGVGVDLAFIFSDPDSSAEEILGACDALDLLPGERRPFVPLAVRRLRAPDALLRAETLSAQFVRSRLIGILENYGDGHDAQILVIMLGDGNPCVRRDAARALARIGGRRELEAMNTWLTSQNHNAPAIRAIIEQRNALERRLDGQRPVPTY
ncbi:MAG TPA: hypothetical protein VGE74_29035 [Gemmata sp.]